jgi:hypothetical protein
VNAIRFLFSTRTKGLLLLLLPLFCGTKTEVVFDFVFVVVVAENSRDDDALIPFCERKVLDKMEKKSPHKFISTRHVLPPSGGVSFETRSRFTRHKESAEEAKDFFVAFVVTNSIVVIIIVGPFEEYGNNNDN